MQMVCVLSTLSLMLAATPVKEARTNSVGLVGRFNSPSNPSQLVIKHIEAVATEHGVEILNNPQPAPLYNFRVPNPQPSPQPPALQIDAFPPSLLNNSLVVEQPAR